MFEKLGMDPKADYPLAVRLDIQRHILDAFEKQCRPVAGHDFITDRTPIDFMAYTLADVQRENVPFELEKQIEQYMANCIDVSNSLFSTIMVVQPGIKLVEEEGKAPANLSYVEHINHLIMGIVVSEFISSHHYYIPRHITLLPDRINCLDFALRRSKEKFDQYKKGTTPTGESIVFH